MYCIKLGRRNPNTWIMSTVIAKQITQASLRHQSEHEQFQG